ncbi:MAG: hypothetical protein ABWX92_15775 [Mycetocola sp.]
METRRQDEPAFDEQARKASLDDLPVVVARAREILGPKVLAYIGHATQTRAVREWISGAVELDAETQRRLRAACYSAVLLHEREGKATVQSWFVAMVPELDDASPAGLLRDRTLVNAIDRVERAARNFWVNG